MHHLHYLESFENFLSDVCRLSQTWVLLTLFSCLYKGMEFGKNTEKKVNFSLCQFREYILSSWLITLINHFIKVESVKFIHCRDSSFPFPHNTPSDLVNKPSPYSREWMGEYLYTLNKLEFSTQINCALFGIYLLFNLLYHYELIDIILFFISYNPY